jgi:hypothetical protein
MAIGVHCNSDEGMAKAFRSYLRITPALPPGPIWEPAAGDGRIAIALRDQGRSALASDLLPRAAGTACHDFLHDPLLSAACGTVVVTNPP